PSASPYGGGTEDDSYTATNSVTHAQTQDGDAWTSPKSSLSSSAVVASSVLLPPCTRPGRKVALILLILRLKQQPKNLLTGPNSAPESKPTWITRTNKFRRYGPRSKTYRKTEPMTGNTLGFCTSKSGYNYRHLL